MNDAYNTAIKYLQGKYGKKFDSYTERFRQSIKNLPLKEQVRRKEQTADKDKIFIIDVSNYNTWPIEDQRIYTLIRQCHSLSNAPKQELELIMNNISNA